MRIIVEYDVPEDDDMYVIINGLESDGDFPGLLEMAECCVGYSVSVER